MALFPETAVIYLSRGADPWWEESAHIFLQSYKRFPAGAHARPYAILKGFKNKIEEARAAAKFRAEGFEPLYLSDQGFDIGAYINAANMLDEKYVCFFNTRSELKASNWLAFMTSYLELGKIKLVAATGSFESLRPLNTHFPKFPNTHLRSNAFATDRELFCKLTLGLTFETKFDAFRFESGRASLTKRVIDAKGELAIVGRNGRAYSPKWWPFSGTFRQGMQENLLVGDNVTHLYDNSGWAEKRHIISATWGRYIREESKLFKI